MKRPSKRFPKYLENGKTLGQHYNAGDQDVVEGKEVLQEVPRYEKLVQKEMPG